MSQSADHDSAATRHRALHGSANGSANGHEPRGGNAVGLEGAAGGREWPPLRPKRALFFGKTKVRTRCTAALVDALEKNGVEVCWLNCSFLKRYFTKPGMRFLVRWIRKRFDPDLLFIFFHDLPAPLMREFSKELPTVVWMEEVYDLRDEHIDYVRDTRLLCLSAPRLVREYRERGIANSTFLLSGFQPAYHHPAVLPQPVAHDRDVAFIGGPGMVGDRPQFLSWLAESFDLEVFGIVESWLPTLHQFPNLRFAREIRSADYAEICARSKIMIGLNQEHKDAYYFSNRLFLTLACRGFHLIHYVPGVEELFEDGVHLAWFKDRDECVDKIRYYLAHDEERNRIAAKGCELVRERHCYEHRVAEILKILAGESELTCPDDPPSVERSMVLPRPEKDASALLRNGHVESESRNREAFGR